MKKTRITLATLCGMFALGAVLATSNPFVATKDYKVNQSTGAAILPMAEISPSSICTPNVTLWCKRTYNLNASGQPTGDGTPVHGIYSE